jgi:hypothetical protein
MGWFNGSSHCHRNTEGTNPLDLAAEFGDKIKDLDPTAYYNFKNPPIKIVNNNKVIYAVHIPRSANRPHMVSSTGRKGNEIMNYHEVKAEFLAYDERRYRLNLLK